MIGRLDTSQKHEGVRRQRIESSSSGEPSRDAHPQGIVGRGEEGRGDDDHEHDDKRRHSPPNSKPRESRIAADAVQ